MQRKYELELIKDPDKARRKARAIVSDILVYNPNQLKEGIENDNLFEILEDAIEEGREYYNSIIDPDLAANSNFFDLAIVDVLVKPGGRHKSKIW